MGQYPGPRLSYGGDSAVWLSGMLPRAAASDFRLEDVGATGQQVPGEKPRATPHPPVRDPLERLASSGLLPTSLHIRLPRRTFKNNVDAQLHPRLRKSESLGRARGPDVFRTSQEALLSGLSSECKVHRQGAPRAWGPLFMPSQGLSRYHLMSFILLYKHQG